MSKPAATTTTTATATDGSSRSSPARLYLPPVPLLPISSPATIRRCKRLRTDARDIFICSYPKSGTTWLQAIVRALITLRPPPQEPPLNDADGDNGSWHITEYCPFFEADRTWRRDDDDEDEDEDEGGQEQQQEQQQQQPFAPLYERRQRETGRRAYNTHLRWDMMPTATAEEGAGARFLYVVRDGRDVAVSYYHHMRSMAVADGGFEGTWGEFFELWCEGKVAFGAWLDHLLSWCGGPAATDPRVLFLRYEEMKADLRTTLATVARHLRIDPPPDERELDRLAAACGLEGMRAHRERYEPRSVAWRDPAFRFIRKGEVGDHAALFTPAQHARFARGLFGRYAAVMVGGEGGDGERDGEPRPGVLPSYVTGALVGGEEGLLVAAAGGGGGGKGCVVDGEGHV